MKGFLHRHPALAEAGDTVLGLLSGGFALAAVAVNWLREKRKSR